MSLTGWPLAGLLIVAVAAALAAVAWGWGRFAGPGVRRLAARLGVLVLCQALVILMALTLVNRHFGFYATWGELVGAAGIGAGRIVPEQGRGETGTALVHRAPEVSVGGSPERDGRLDTVDIHGVRSGLDAHAYVYLPPQYFDRAAKDRRFPVALAFSGYPGVLSNLVTQVRLPQTARDEGRAGRARPTVYVMLRPSTAPGRDTECLDVPGGPQSATFFTQDVPDAVRSAYRVSGEARGWGALGLSTGGYCSLKLAMRHSDVFSRAASLSGYYGAIKDLTTGDLYGGSQAVRNENDLFWRLRHRPQPPISVLLTTSRVGEGNKNGTQRFLSLVRPPMRASSLVLDSGGHNFGTWRRVLPQVLRWMSQGLTP
ncbi:alpha/beta hydrolase [Actinomadura syzygii]|uniref:Esterase family protein n=1 Tax=Actinomadura syzygii TaxID=1427538 RepID=A0A5D0TNY3_9ACTN|nr:alpha/beta hydrolase-fold protein [Actinomadura syzygii]TYC07838.1 esterase family protein [Actinomadura syzygii]